MYDVRLVHPFVKQFVRRHGFGLVAVLLAFTERLPKLDARHCLCLRAPHTQLFSCQTCTSAVSPIRLLWNHLLGLLVRASFAFVRFVKGLLQSRC